MSKENSARVKPTHSGAQESEELSGACSGAAVLRPLARRASGPSPECLQLNELLPHVITCPINIPWRPRKQMEGQNESDSKGRAGSIYCDFQPYYPGAPITRLNWKLWARDPRRPMLTEYDEENRVTVCVLTDVGSDMDFGGQAFTKQELAALLTWSLFQSAGLTQEYGRFVAFSRDRVELVLPAGGADFAASLAVAAAESTLELTGFSGRPGDGPTQALFQLPAERSLTFIISDFHWLLKDDPRAQENREMLAFAASNHEVICLVVQDLDERKLPELKLFGIRLPGFLQVGDSAGDGSTTVYTGAANSAELTACHARQQAQQCAWFDTNDCRYAIFRTEESEDSRRERLVSVLTGDRQQLCLDPEIGDVYAEAAPPRAMDGIAPTGISTTAKAERRKP